jgi:hypothetical protein
MTRPLTKQTRAILRGLKAGKRAAQIAKDLNIPTYTVYNAKHRHSALVNQKAEEELTRKQSAMSTDAGTFASRNAAHAHEAEALSDLVFRQTQYGLGRSLPKQLSLWGRIKAVFTGEYA